MTELQDDIATAQFDAALEAHESLIADFYTPSCVICKKIEPMLGALEKSLQGRLHAVKIDAEANPELAAKYQVRGVPTLILFRGGRLVDRKSGFMTATMLRQWVEPHVGG
ncbi:MAG: thioredoxin family protein [Gammaproteobacteria bacterium]|nr:thioredoxin family protein [Gammaproteobacteria bacterium]NIR82925.1 thioredoxin family protein [Gammaproteobacteria bacterium]NIR90194.1 thioredoxin family protein [Gammaproteobacteria bacterium]NIU04071.1 thioredoxin family protein [Gammaproteobacteria bacterium]NIV51060.1 thioredoxin fold domain-containing protein [Gammaproteobacteria bacterium]